MDYYSNQITQLIEELGKLPGIGPKSYFLSGFTAKLAGTERGITEPTPTFSACFGQAVVPVSYTHLDVYKRQDYCHA